MPKQFLIGADPELFLQSVDSNKFISSIGKIGGSKEEPKSIGGGCAVQEDNVAVEFNIPPCQSVEQFVKSINYNLAYLEKIASKIGCKLAITASAVFDEDELSSRAARQFGCEPDYCVWTGAKNPSPCADNKNLRSAGGHIHVSTELNKELVVKSMDLFVGVPLTVKDTDTARRQLYGKAGAYRPKYYGIEYRTASNWWISSDESMKWVYHQTEKALDFLEEGGNVTDDVGVLIQKAINDSDPSAFAELKEMFSLTV